MSARGAGHPGCPDHPHVRRGGYSGCPAFRHVRREGHPGWPDGMAVGRASHPGCMAYPYVRRAGQRGWSDGFPAARATRRSIPVLPESRLFTAFPRQTARNVAPPSPSSPAGGKPAAQSTKNKHTSWPVMKSLSPTSSSSPSQRTLPMERRTTEPPSA